MKKSALLALLLLTAGAVAASAVEPVVEQQIRLKIMADDDLLDLDLSDLAVGESQQLYTESGKEVVVTRSEDSFEIQVEGRDEPIIVHTGAGHAYAFDVEAACQDADDCLHRVIVNSDVEVADHDGDEVHSMVFIGEDGDAHALGDQASVWVSAKDEENGEGLHVIRVGGGEDAAQKLLASGALDGLDLAKRQEILDALREGSGEAKVHMKVIKKHHHDEDREHER